MPPAVPAIVAAIGVKSAIGAFLVSTALSTAFSVAFSAVTRALAKKARAPTIGKRDRSVSIRQPVQPWQVIIGKQQVGGTLTFLGTSSGSQPNNLINIVVTVAGHRVASIGDPYFDGVRVPLGPDGTPTSGPYVNHLNTEKRLGDADQPALVDLQPRSNGKWGADHRQRGRAHVYLRLSWNPDVYPNGIPAIRFDVDGTDEIYDPRTGSTGFSRNPALALAWYLTHPRFGVGATWDEIDEDLLITAANICDEAVPIKAGGIEPRYQCDGAFDVDSKPQDIIPAVLSSMSGDCVFAGGKWQIYAGAYRAPTRTLTGSDLRGAISMQTLISGRERFNGIKGTFIDPQRKWQESDFPAVKSDAFMAEDGGERKWKDVEFPFTTSVSMIQRLAKIELLKSRQELSTTWPVKFGSGFPLSAPDVVGLSFDRYGWVNKPFQVITSSVVVDDQDSVPLLGTTLTLRETDPSIYDWSTDEEQTVDPAPNTGLPSAFDVQPPGAPTVSEDLYQTRPSAGVKARARMTWVAAADAFVDRYIPEYRLAMEQTWTPLASTTGNTAEVLDIGPGTYDFRVTAVAVFGVRASSPIHTQQVFGLSAAPNGMTGLSLQKVSGLALLSWDRSTDLDVLIGGSVRWRHSSKQVGATLARSVSIGKATAGAETRATLPLKPGTYIGQVVDSSGVSSTSVATVSTDGAEVLRFSPVGSVVEHPSFAGAKTDVVLDGSTLKLDAQASGSVRPRGTYVFSAGIDQGLVKRCRLIGTIDAIVNNVQDVISARRLISTWPSVIGDTSTAADGQILVRQTDDDPDGAPTWSSWQPLDSGDFEARAFQFQLEITSGDPAYNIVVSELSVSCSEVL